MRYILAVFGLLVLCAGCADVYFEIPFADSEVDESYQDGSYQDENIADPVPAEVPVVNVPHSLRMWNYAGGSCVHASTESEFNWLNQLELAVWWRKNYSGGESYSGLVDKLLRNKIPYKSTHNGDVAHLEWCVAERRGAVIFYYTNHSILLVHLDAEKAIVLDNNRIDYFIEIPREEFLSNWKGFGGVAVTPLIGAPAPPIPWIES